MKNQEKIFDIQCDIKALENNINARKIVSSYFGADTCGYVSNIRDAKIIKQLQHTVDKLRKEDAKIWKESLIIAHGGFRAWWLDNWGFVWIGLCIAIASCALVAILAFNILRLGE